MKSLSQETEELRAQLIQMEKELHFLRTELEAQKEANVRSPSNTMKNLVERLKTQLALKEKQLKVTHSGQCPVTLVNFHRQNSVIISIKICADGNNS